VGKSGPWTKRIRSSFFKSGLSIKAQIASQISPRLWGAMFVAIPTAIPLEPLINKLGMAEGSTVGSMKDSS
jgi:hypothetical protein